MATKRTIEEMVSAIKGSRKKARERQAASGVQAPLVLMAGYDKDLQKALKGLFAKVEKVVSNLVFKDVEKYVADVDIEKAANAQVKQLGLLAKEAEAVAAKWMGRTDKFHRKAFVADINRAVGVNVADILTDKGTEKALAKAIDDNVKLIKSIPVEYLDKVQTMITQGLDGRKTLFSSRADLQAWLEKEMKVESGIASRRAKLIARDQVSKLTGSLTKIRQEDIGVERYEWITSRDGERVRPTHRKNDGKSFKWGDPPSVTGHPGDDVQCRCIAKPDLSHLLKLAK